MKYRKKPVVVEAIKVSEACTYAKHAWNNLPGWLLRAYDNGEILFSNFTISVLTLEGTMVGDCNDMLICGVNGEIYPCKPDVFAKTYEPVDEAT